MNRHKPLHQGLEPRCEEAMIGCFTRVRWLGRDLETLSAAQRHTTRRLGTRECPRPHAPAAPPPRLVMTRGRRRQIDTAHQFCPNPACAYWGWVGWGNLRANGHPNGGPWRQLLRVACHRPALTASTALAAALQVC